MAVESITEAAQYLTFTLSEEIFALPVLKVREVLDYMNITKVPQAPDFMRGVINVRGSVVPVVDMRLKLGMTATEQSVNTCIILTEIAIEEDTTVIGALADSVKEVMDLDPEHIDPPPKIGSKWRTEFIRGIGKRDEDFIIILDIDRVFTTDELMMVGAGSEAVTEAEAAPEQDGGMEAQV